MSKQYFSLFILLFILCENSVAQSILHGPRTEKKIAITFDACPSRTRGGYDSSIARILVDSGVPATFFLSGTWIQRHRHEVQKLAAVPIFELANHSFSHPHCLAISNESIRQEVQKTEKLLKQITGTSPLLFRPPFAQTDSRVDSIVQNLGLTSVLFDLASGDPDSSISKERLTRYVISETTNGSIIIMHVNGRGRYTAEILPHIIQSLRKKGFVFVKVSELLKKGVQNKNS
jgi:peptidoglycan-N-acetylglucosamine deacetylase